MAPAAGTIVAIFAVWEGIVLAFHPGRTVLPSPVSVVADMARNWPIIGDNILPTAEETLIGFGLAIACGIALGVSMGVSRKVERALYPLVVGGNSLPKVAIGPLLVIWFGFNIIPKVGLTLIICLLPIVINTATGIASVPQEMHELARLMRLRRRTKFWRIQFMYALPEIFAGLKIAASLALVGAVVAEFVASSHGLGYLLTAAEQQVRTRIMFGDIIILTVMGYLLTVVVAAFEHWLIPWHESQQRSR